MNTKTTCSLTTALCRAALAIVLVLGIAPSMAFAAQDLQTGATDSAASASVSTMASAPGKGKIASAQSLAAGKAIVKAKKISGATGYQYKVSLNKAFTKGVKTKTTTKLSVTFKGLAKGKTYYVKVRAYKKSGSSKKWGKWSAKAAVRIATAKLTKRTEDSMYFLPQDSRTYGSISSAYLVGSQLVFMGGGVMLGESQGEGVFLSEPAGANSSFTVTANTRYHYEGSTVSKSTCNKLLAAHTNFNWIQVDVAKGKVTDVYL